MITKSTFKPAWWLPGPHLQTVAPKLLAWSGVESDHEILELPDGDFLELCWSEKPNFETTAPIVILLHGVEGSMDSHYIVRMLATLKEQGLIGVAMLFRSCGKYMNRHARAYHFGETRDIRYLVRMFSRWFPKAPLFCVGYSLGGNVLANLLAEDGDIQLKAAAVVCSPLNLVTSVAKINSGLSKFYQTYLLTPLKKKVSVKINDGLITHISLDELDNIKTLREFDEYVTAPLFNFKSADDYYLKTSALNLLKDITVPTLVIHAEDDPFVHIDPMPTEADLSKYVTFEVSESGGHVGFVAGDNPLHPEYWLDQRIIDFLLKSGGRSQ